MNSPLGIFHPLAMMLDRPLVAIALAVAASFFLIRINERRRRAFALALLCVLPLIAMIAAYFVDGCSGDIPENFEGYQGLSKPEECWGKYGFGGVMFLMVGLPIWLLSVAAGGFLSWVGRR